MVYVLYTLLANLVPALVKAYCWQQRGSARAAAARAAEAGVPKPPKNRFLKAREAQNGGFGTGQGRGRAGAAAGQQHGQQQGQQQGQDLLSGR